MKKLRILIITQGVWSPKLGAVKVHIDIKKEYERLGHNVDKIALEDLYPNGQNAFTKIFGKLYTEVIFNYLKKNAYKYDVIDANSYCVIYPKESFGFKGVLLFRSHGIDPIYRWAEQNIESYKKALVVSPKEIKFKTRIGNIYRSLQKKVTMKEFDLSFKYADIVHCLNSAEYDYFIERGVPKEKLLLLPNGIPDELINQLNTVNTLNRDNSISFIGYWSVRKGIKDMDNIISRVAESTRIFKLFLLGGQYPVNKIRDSFSATNNSILEIIPDFSETQLLGYIEKCKVGIFPSYIEGFGLAVVEQLALGIPVVAYDVPGPSSILDSVDISLLINPGEIDTFSAKVIAILNLDPMNYKLLSEKCKIASHRFLLSKVTQHFLDKYYDLLNQSQEKTMK